MQIGSGWHSRMAEPRLSRLYNSRFTLTSIFYAFWRDGLPAYLRGWTGWFLHHVYQTLSLPPGLHFAPSWARPPRRPIARKVLRKREWLRGTENKRRVAARPVAPYLTPAHMSAAHRTLPFGSCVRLTRLANHRPSLSPSLIAARTCADACSICRKPPPRGFSGY